MGGPPIRRCLACRRTAPKHELVRLGVAGEPSGASDPRMVVGDPTSQLPGRGAYLCGDPSCLEAALRRGGAPVIRALRLQDTQVSVDDLSIRVAWSATQQPAGGAHEHERARTSSAATDVVEE